MGKWIFLLLALTPAFASAEVVCEGGVCRVGQAVRNVVTAPVRALRHPTVVVADEVVVHQPAPVIRGARAVVADDFVSAQCHADRLASQGFTTTWRGGMVQSHTHHRGGSYGGGAEGVGFSTVSPSAAVSASCMWGTRKPREIATAWCPSRRGWVAVVRYH